MSDGPDLKLAATSLQDSWAPEESAPPSHMVVDRYYVAAVAKLLNGVPILCGISPLFETCATAVRHQDELRADFPGCGVVAVSMALDPADPQQLAELDVHVSRLCQELRTLQ